ncbi:MAG: radical SAM protein, partial [Clostridia bacterium]|nr:radical SAM protein [Clostridia bacterium]
NEPSEEVLSQVADMKERGFLSSKKVKEVKHPLTDKIEEHLDKKIERMTLQITQNCNFRCSYCPYSTSEFDNTRTHSSRRMSEETAKKAIEFLADHSTDSEMVALSFYGGEPLLEFELIKRLIEYADELFLGRKVIYSMTTNGSLLNDEIISFFEEHELELTISLDGTQKLHDKHRKFASNGQGTYAVIEKNLKHIYETHRDYFCNFMSINMVMDPRYSFKEFYDLQISDEMYRELYILTNVVDSEFSFEKPVYEDDFIINECTESFKALLAIIGKYPKEKVAKSIFEGQLAEKSKSERYVNKFRSMLSDKEAPAGACVPGKKLFCDVNGIFHICEKTSETSSALVLGNVDDGFDYDNIKKLLNIGKLTEEKCKNCFAFGLCNICAKHCDNNGELSAEKKMTACRQSQRDALDMINNYIFYYEMGNLMKKEML